MPNVCDATDIGGVVFAMVMFALCVMKSGQRGICSDDVLDLDRDVVRKGGRRQRFRFGDFRKWGGG